MPDIDWLASLAGALGAGALLPAIAKAITDRRKNSAAASIDEQRAIGIASENYLTVMRELGNMNTKLLTCMEMHRTAADALQKCEETSDRIMNEFKVLKAKVRRAGESLAQEDLV